VLVLRRTARIKIPNNPCAAIRLGKKHPDTEPARFGVYYALIHNMALQHDHPTWDQTSHLIVILTWRPLTREGFAQDIAHLNLRLRTPFNPLKTRSTGEKFMPICHAVVRQNAENLVGRPVDLNLVCG